MARLSRQAGEEGAERRRVEMEKKEIQEKLANIEAELEKTKQSLANSDAKVVLFTQIHTTFHSLKNYNFFFFKTVQ